MCKQFFNSFNDFIYQIDINDNIKIRISNYEVCTITLNQIEIIILNNTTELNCSKEKLFEGIQQACILKNLAKNFDENLLQIFEDLYFYTKKILTDKDILNFLQKSSNGYINPFLYTSEELIHSIEYTKKLCEDHLDILPEDWKNYLQEILDNNKIPILIDYFQKRELKERKKEERKEEKGYIYIIKSNLYYKIGKAKDIKQRYKDIEITNPDIELIYSKEFENYHKIEKDLHKKFKEKHYKGEWFKLNSEDINLILSM